MTAVHPARFPAGIVEIATEKLVGYDRVLDPFAGSGRVHQLSNFTVGVEIEPDWKMEFPGATILGNSRQLPFQSGSFDAVFTSPVYGNRMSDHHNARDVSVRNTYTHRIGHALHVDNAGRMHWGHAYWELHTAVWFECARVVRPRGRFILNTKDFLRTRRGKQERVTVTDWHARVLINFGFALAGCEAFKTEGNGYGANGKSRVEYEDVLIFDKL